MAETIYSMRKFLCLLLVLCSSAVFAAPGDSLSRHHNFYFEPGASIDYSYRFLKTNNSQLNSLVNARDSMEKPSAGYSLGLNFGKQITNRLDFVFGFRLLVNGYKTIPYQLIVNGDSVATISVVSR